MDRKIIIMIILDSSQILEMHQESRTWRAVYTLYPAWLNVDDWIEIPLSTEFVYDPGKNLVISMAGDSGTNKHVCRANSFDAVQYPARSVISSNRLELDGNIHDTVAELRLWFAK